jgi:hypothetical protein
MNTIKQNSSLRKCLSGKSLFLVFWETSLNRKGKNLYAPNNKWLFSWVPAMSKFFFLILIIFTGKFGNIKKKWYFTCSKEGDNSVSNNFCVWSHKLLNIRWKIALPIEFAFKHFALNFKRLVSFLGYHRFL